MDILVKALSLVAIVLIGHSIKRAGWVRASDFGIFSKIVLRLTLPCALAVSFDRFTITPLLLAVLAGIGIVVNALLQLVALLLARREGRIAQAFAVMNLSSFNMGAFATPYLAGFMGPQAVVYASLFDVGNSMQAAGVGYAAGQALARPGTRITPWSFVRQMTRSVVFDTYLVLAAMSLLHLHIPRVLMPLLTTIGNANTFLAMLMIGIGLELRLDPVRYRRAIRYLAARYATVLVAALMIWQLPLGHDIRLVLVMVVWAPIAAMISGYTDEAGLDVELSTFMTSVSIVVAIVMLPTVLMVLG